MENSIEAIPIAEVTCEGCETVYLVTDAGAPADALARRGVHRCLCLLHSPAHQFHNHLKERPQMFLLSQYDTGIEQDGSLLAIKIFMFWVFALCAGC